MCFKNGLGENFMKNGKENFDSLIRMVWLNKPFKNEDRLT
jgi:hypothetical protein